MATLTTILGVAGLFFMFGVNFLLGVAMLILELILTMECGKPL